MSANRASLPTRSLAATAERACCTVVGHTSPANFNMQALGAVYSLAFLQRESGKRCGSERGLGGCDYEPRPHIGGF